MKKTQEETLEHWMPVPGYKESYEVSSLGRVKSKRRDKLMKLAKSPYGYLKVGLHKNGSLKTFSVHRLVCLAFLENPSNYPQVNHTNCIKDDNRLSNLEWCNASQNLKHASVNGLLHIYKGEDHVNSKISNNQADEIRIKSKQGRSQRQLAREYNISQRNIQFILHGVAYRNSDLLSYIDTMKEVK